MSARTFQHIVEYRGKLTVETSSGDPLDAVETALEQLPEGAECECNVTTEITRERGWDEARTRSKE